MGGGDFFFHRSHNPLLAALPEVPVVAAGVFFFFTFSSEMAE